MKTILVLSLFLFSHAFAAPFIIGGSKASMSEFPWQVSLQNNDGHFCGGSIISKRLILTAAHCLVVPNIRVYGGGDGSEWKMKRLGVVKNITIHENWLRSRKLNDIGLIELNEDITFGDDISAIELATDKDFKIGAKVILTGLGVVVDPNISGEIKYPSFLQKVELTLAPKLNDYKYWSKQISTYYAEKYDEYGLSAIADMPNKRFNERKGGCYADSGGPLVIQTTDKTYRLLGVVSKLIEGCGVSTIFTYVPSHQNWIRLHSSLE